ncbi:PAS and ANTAR domain-containing protein [Nocardia jejuensis]|uniref:PAS and ANTAR domain-containing protein n=1 Tax=Nocardia jejuensis TaxID=328049 RepID=UPI000A01C6E4|nr:PAS and ANTAR domain-containing protein [Nocardia jejuensis]
MSTNVPPASPSAGVPAQNTNTNPIGSFRFWFADERWEWSEQVARLHGYDAAMAPTTETVLSHNHPDDRESVAAILSASVGSGDPFCSRHRIIDAAGVERQVLVVGDLLRDDSDAAIGTSGYFIDLTEILEQTRVDALDEAFAEAIEDRAAIEQAKGVLMFVYGLSPDQAFGVLRWRSQDTNTKLRVLATKFAAAVTAFGGAPVKLRAEFDHLLLTAHELPDP